MPGFVLHNNVLHLLCVGQLVKWRGNMDVKWNIPGRVNHREVKMQTINLVQFSMVKGHVTI